jgi:hypothetical protein
MSMRPFLKYGLGCSLLFGSACGADAKPTPGSPTVEAGSGAVAPGPAQAGSPAQSPSSTASPPPIGSTPAANVPAANTPAANTPAGATPPAGAPAGTPPAGTTPAANTPPGAAPLAMDECGLKTNYAGDQYCINAPPEDKGFQLHIGPTSYDNPEAEYLLQPGQEVTSSFMSTSTNKQKIFFYYRQFRMRPGAHHNIITSQGTDRMADVGRRIGTSNHLSEDNPKGNLIAPENKGVGIPLEANTPIGVSLHSINTTDKPLLREVWVNFWYRDPAEVTEPVEELFEAGDASFMIEPHQDVVLGPYTCDMEGDGRMLWFYGHRHANNVRFSAWRIRGEQRDLFYEGYNWEDPLVLEYASNVVNTKPDPMNMIEGGWSGILDFKTGDRIEWECHVINKTDGTLRFTNNTFTGEMCIMDAELVNSNCMAQPRARPRM